MNPTTSIVDPLPRPFRHRPPRERRDRPSRADRVVTVLYVVLLVCAPFLVREAARLQPPGAAAALSAPVAAAPAVAGLVRAPAHPGR